MVELAEAVSAASKVKVAAETAETVMLWRSRPTAGQPEASETPPEAHDPPAPA